MDLVATLPKNGYFAPLCTAPNTVGKRLMVEKHTLSGQVLPTIKPQWRSFENQQSPIF